MLRPGPACGPSPQTCTCPPCRNPREHARKPSGLSLSPGTFRRAPRSRCWVPRRPACDSLLEITTPATAGHEPALEPSPAQADARPRAPGRPRQRAFVPEHG